ncbi:hypothetical protein BCR42DRAFT_430587 [Absidia repens]|uniref:Uncharacterized protein n=1 Tax=Absidia repens TaxID=90262 RepID=A0A1X2HBG9_9FUNG|nr:hypothetical protein BCR42DRAFT_430587 [Absidia repens]
METLADFVINANGNGMAQTYNTITPRTFILSPHKPRLSKVDYTTLTSNFDIILSEYQTSSPSSASTTITSSQQLYNENREQQTRNQSLNDAPGTLEFLLEALNQPLDNIRQFVWLNGYATDNKEEAMNNDTIRHILTDFYLNCNIDKDNRSTSTNERTPFSEHLIPIFKAFAGITHLMKFTWCEKGLASNRLLSLCLPNKVPVRSLLDGIGVSIKDGAERILIESSGDDMDHSEEDTIKQICNTSNCLKVDMKVYRAASFDTFLRRQVFGLQFIHDKMTLTTTRMINKERYAFIETRSAIIPTSFKDIWKWIKAFELLLKLKADLQEQEKVTELLEYECTGVADIGLTVEDALK